MPTKTELSKFSIRGSVTESAANTYTEQSISTNLVAQGDAMFMATGLWVMMDPKGVLVNADEQWMHLAYTSQSFVITPSHADFIWGQCWQNTGAAAVLEVIRYIPIDHFPIASPTIYLGTQGVSLAQAGSVAFKLAGYLQKVSTTDFFRIANLR